MTTDNPAAAKNLVRVWWSVFRSQHMTVQQLLLAAENRLIPGSGELKTALAAVAPSLYGDAGVSAHRLGHWLVRASAGPIEVQLEPTADDDGASSFNFVKRGTMFGRQVWQLLPHDGAPSPASASAPAVASHVLNVDLSAVFEDESLVS